MHAFSCPLCGLAAVYCGSLSNHSNLVVNYPTTSTSSDIPHQSSSVTCIAFRNNDQPFLLAEQFLRCQPIKTSIGRMLCRWVSLLSADNQDQRAHQGYLRNKSSNKPPTDSSSQAKFPVIVSSQVNRGSWPDPKCHLE